MIITNVNAYNVLRCTCECKSSNQFNKQETSELLVYIYKKRSRCTPEFHTLIPLSYKIPIYIFTKTYTYYRYDEIKFIDSFL